MSSSTIDADHAPSLTLDQMQLRNVLPGQPDEELVSKQLEDVEIVTLRGVIVQMNTTIFRLLMSAQTTQEFKALRKDELFEKYVRLSLAAVNLVGAAVPEQSTYQEFVQHSFESIADSFENAPILDADARDEALFCLSTLHRAYGLLPEMLRTVPANSLKRDSQLCSRFVGSMFWSQMHLDCLRFAINNRLAPTPEVLRSVLAGFRESLSCYAAIRESAELRVPEEMQADESPIQWDAEDRL